MTAVIGFLTMCYPIVDKGWFVSFLSMCLAVMAMVLMVSSIVASGSLQRLTQASGFKRYTFLTVNLLAAAFFATEHVELTLGYLGFAILIYFLADEWLDIATAYRDKSSHLLLSALLDNALTLAAIVMLMTNVELRGETLVTLILGIKVALFGFELMLSGKSEYRY